MRNVSDYAHGRNSSRAYNQLYSVDTVLHVVRREVLFLAKRYKLKMPARAIETIEGRLVSITIPAGEIVEVLAAPTDKSDMLVDVLLEGRTIAMHVIDVNAHATEIND